MRLATATTRATTRSSARLAVRSGVAAVCVALVASTGSAPAAGPPGGGGGDRASGEVRVVADGLANPFGNDATPRGRFVAESGAGTVTLVRWNGTRRTVLSGVPGVAGVTARGRWVWSITGGAGPDGGVPGGAYGQASVLRTDLKTGRTRKIADLLRYELRRNPDGQTQFAPDGTPYDALSNPFSISITPRGLLVADGGANAVLKVHPRTGRVSTFFVPPNVRGGACESPEAQANPGTRGCDPVPTGVARYRQSIYVSTEGAGAPGAGRIYRLGAGNGRVQQVWRGLDGPTGVAASGAGVVYSQVFGGGEAGPPGRLVRVRKGRSTTFDVPFPTGLTAYRGSLLVSANSLAEGAGGQLLQVPYGQFR